ncbi:MAG: hypothetical protein Hyperionvirus4_53 [Hyperionvirus sp.]|uniref:Uncharacterized protein n=1 Tax=Hyperionvirus sp. TaxID=2487770 RepID=A0A3G5A7E1_9VIRU|nr:MAG: hypothetical protein Hyperionvirus4_53 [Hyperionvirus sp.]
MTLPKEIADAIKLLEKPNNKNQLVGLIKNFMEQNQESIPTFSKLAEFVKLELGPMNLTNIDKKFWKVLKEMNKDMEELVQSIENDELEEYDDELLSHLDEELLGLLKANKVSKEDNILKCLNKINGKLDRVDQSYQFQDSINYLNPIKKK